MNNHERYHRSEKVRILVRQIDRILGPLDGPVNAALADNLARWSQATRDELGRYAKLKKGPSSITWGLVCQTFRDRAEFDPQVVVRPAWGISTTQKEMTK